MPESFITPLEDRCFALESFVEHTQNHDAPASTVIRNNYGRSQAAIAEADRFKAAMFTPKLATTPKTRRKRARSTHSDVASPAHTTKQVASPRKGSSIHYGVRFRQDLHKWVAEIRVAEWKDVDKKVWLGTFDTEEGAARGVDLARKLLRCTKKRPANLPCPELERYCTTIPAHLDLTDLANEAMFKDVVAFIKNECQAYAARFAKTTTTTIPPVPQIFTQYPQEDVFWNHEYLSHSTDANANCVFAITDILEAEFDPFGEFDGYSTPGSSSEPSSFRHHSDSFAVEIARGELPGQQQQQAAAAAAAARAWEMEVDLGVEPVCHDVYSLPQTWPGSLNTGLEAEYSPPHMPGDAGDMAYFFDHANHT